MLGGGAMPSLLRLGYGAGSDNSNSYKLEWPMNKVLIVDDHTFRTLVNS